MRGSQEVVDGGKGCGCEAEPRAEVAQVWGPRCGPVIHEFCCSFIHFMNVNRGASRTIRLLEASLILVLRCWRSRKVK